MRLLDLVQEQHAVRMLVDRVGEQPALIEAHIARRGADKAGDGVTLHVLGHVEAGELDAERARDRKSTRLNSSHPSSSYAVFCLKKKRSDIMPCSFSSASPPSFLSFFYHASAAEIYTLSLHDALPILRMLVDRVGEQPALIEAHIARRGADKAGDGVTLHVLGHVEAGELDAERA